MMTERISDMKKLLAAVLTVTMSVSLAACGAPAQENKSQEPAENQAENMDKTETEAASGTEEGAAGDYKIAYLTDRLGDNSVNDAFYSGAERFMEETGVEITTLEHTSLQDYEINARALCQEGYDLIVYPFSTAAEILLPLAEEFPDTHFYIQNTQSDLPNVTSYRFMNHESAFLTGAFSVLMNQELGGEAKSAFIGGMRNPTLEQAQFSFEAGSRYVEGEPTVVYVGSFTDIAKGKEVASQLYQDGYHLIQAYAGGAGTGVFQAAESMPEGYWALGEADGQFGLSERIVASMVANMGDLTYGVITDFTKGTLESGLKAVGYADGAVKIGYAPAHEAEIPQTVKDKIKELEELVVSGQIVPPTTQEEYDAFAAEYLK